MVCWYGVCQFFDTTKTIQLSKTLFLVTTRWTRLALPLFCIHQKRTNQQTKYAMRMKGSTGAKKWKFFSLVYSRVWIIFCFMKCRKSPLFRQFFFSRNSHHVEASPQCEPSQFLVWFFGIQNKDIDGDEANSFLPILGIPQATYFFLVCLFCLTYTFCMWQDVLMECTANSTTLNRIIQRNLWTSHNGHS